jgi:CheY-like chemotaxis protein
VREYNRTSAVIASRSLLGQVFLNLLVNAAQAFEDGDATGQEIRVRTRSDRTHVIIEIADTGLGISPALQQRIFEPFFTTKPVGVGTGLGLSFCRDTIEGMGGTIEVDSQHHRGTTFRILLPSTSRQATPSPPPRTELVGRQTSGGRRVLVIDDEDALTEAIMAVLMADEVVVANSGEEGLNALNSSRFDVVLCDIMMPTMPGPEVYMAIQERWPDLIPRVAFITGGTFTEQTRIFLENTTALVLTKPFRAHALRELVDTLSRR